MRWIHLEDSINDSHSEVYFQMQMSFRDQNSVNLELDGEWKTGEKGKNGKWRKSNSENSNVIDLDLPFVGMRLWVMRNYVDVDCVCFMFHVLGSMWLYVYRISLFTNITKPLISFAMLNMMNSFFIIIFGFFLLFSLSCNGIHSRRCNCYKM